MAKISRSILISLAALLCLVTALPFIKTDEWWVRIWDFPRIQIFSIGLPTLAMCLASLRKSGRWAKAVEFLLTVALIVQAVKIYPYTFLAPVEVKSSVQQNSSPVVRILIANVLTTNRSEGQLREMVAGCRPDLILLTETDDWWVKHMRPMEREYPFTSLYPLDNTYGISLYSRLELIDTKVLFLTDPSVPSIHTNVRLPGGQLVRFFGIHPRPPGLEQPKGDERQDTAQRDAELVIVGRDAARAPLPVIVAGDFNDVAWSHTTRLFQRISRLLDPRIGRGFYNTYNAKLWFLRFPVDHLFHSDEFTLVAMRRLGYFGSDHFPIFAALHMNPAAAIEQEAPKGTPSDTSQKKEVIREFREEQREGK